MQNRIIAKFRNLKQVNKKAFIAFITAGDPNLKTTEELVVSFEKAGVDIVELGVPFSDPMADGPTIQASSERALKKGVTLFKILQSVKRIRRQSQMPIALMTYYNPVFHYGEKRFIKDAVAAGVDGVIIPDLPPEEATVFRAQAKTKGLSTVFFISPTTTPQRIKKVSAASSGFIYYVSLTGVTGARKALPGTVAKQIRLAKKYTNKPICVGFGVSTRAQVKSMAKVADGVIVGSAIVREIAKHAGKANLVQSVSKFVKSLLI